MKTIVIKLLHALTRFVLKKYKPTIIAITGSVGKTATKEAVFAVLATKYNVRKSMGNYNTEIGLPLTVLGVPAPGASLVKWLKLFSHGLGLLWFGQTYPEMLVLEMGADKPGDIGELLRVVSPKVGIITAISPTHTERFGSVAGVAQEKGKLFDAPGRDGWLVVNKDDDEVVSLAKGSKAQIITIGIESEADIRASEISVSRSEQSPTGIAGLSFKLLDEGTVTPALLPGVIGEHQVYAALFAAAAGKIFDIHAVDVVEALRRVRPLPGRMRVLGGVKNTVIIDDTYNSSPKAAAAALTALADLAAPGKKFAVLGDMLELGALTEDEHRKIGRLAAKGGIDVLITVGERSRDTARAARAAGLEEDRVFEFSDTAEAGLFLQERIHAGDAVLIKGSRGMQLEAIVKEIMAEPERSKELLVNSY